MALKSKFSDVDIPQDLSWPQFVFQNFEANGSKTAIVSGVSISLSYLNRVMYHYTKLDLSFTVNGLVDNGLEVTQTNKA